MLAVVVDVLLGGPAVLQDVVVVPVVDDENTTGFQHTGKVLEALFVIPFLKTISFINPSTCQ